MPPVCPECRQRAGLTGHADGCAVGFGQFMAWLTGDWRWLVWIMRIWVARELRGQ